MRKLATVLALSLAGTHGLPTPRGSIAKKKDEAKDDAPRLRGGISKDVDEAVNSGRKPLMGSITPPGFVGESELCGSACDLGAPVSTVGDPDATCGSHVQFVLDNSQPISEVEACAQVAGEYPDACGSCTLCGSACDYRAIAWTPENPMATCGSHVQFVLDNSQPPISEAEACAKVAGEYSDACGSCASAKCAPPCSTYYESAFEIGPRPTCEDKESPSRCSGSLNCCPGANGGINCGSDDCANDGKPCKGTWMAENCEMSCGLCEPWPQSPITVDTLPKGGDCVAHYTDECKPGQECFRCKAYWWRYDYGCYLSNYFEKDLTNLADIDTLKGFQDIADLADDMGASAFLYYPKDDTESTTVRFVNRTIDPPAFARVPPSECTWDQDKQPGLFLDWDTVTVGEPCGEQSGSCKPDGYWSCVGDPVKFTTSNTQWCVGDISVPGNCVKFHNGNWEIPQFFIGCDVAKTYSIFDPARFVPDLGGPYAAASSCQGVMPEGRLYVDLGDSYKLVSAVLYLGGSEPYGPQILCKDANGHTMHVEAHQEVRTPGEYALPSECAGATWLEVVCGGSCGYCQFTELNVEPTKGKLVQTVEPGLYVRSNPQISPRLPSDGRGLWISGAHRTKTLIPRIKNQLNTCFEMFGRAARSKELQELYHEIDGAAKKDLFLDLIMNGVTIGLSLELGPEGIGVLRFGDWMKSFEKESQAVIMEGDIFDDLARAMGRPNYFGKLIRGCARRRACTVLANSGSEALAQSLQTLALHNLQDTPGEDAAWAQQFYDQVIEFHSYTKDKISDELHDATNTNLLILDLLTRHVPKGTIVNNTCNQDDQNLAAQQALDAGNFVRKARGGFTDAAGSWVQYGLCKDNRPCTKTETNRGTYYDCGYQLTFKTILKDPIADGYVKYVLDGTKQYDNDWRSTPCYEHF